MTIRYAENKDYLWLKENDKHISDEIMKTKIAAREIYVVEEDNELTGWLRYNLFWDNIPFMNLLFILEEHRRKGTGKILVHHWEKDMKDKGYKNVLTSTRSDEEAQHFYRKMGYVEIGGFKFSDEPLEIIFCKTLICRGI
jgi:N-acetylglutamate synthase-like GNAT family acetyltransferase